VVILQVSIPTFKSSVATPCSSANSASVIKADQVMDLVHAGCDAEDACDGRMPRVLPPDPGDAQIR
jgi:hypothetical protein